MIKCLQRSKRQFAPSILDLYSFAPENKLHVVLKDIYIYTSGIPVPEGTVKISKICNRKTVKIFKIHNCKTTNISLPNKKSVYFKKMVILSFV